MEFIPRRDGRLALPRFREASRIASQSVGSLLEPVGRSNAGKCRMDRTSSRGSRGSDRSFRSDRSLHAVDLSGYQFEQLGTGIR